MADLEASEVATTIPIINQLADPAEEHPSLWEPLKELRASDEDPMDVAVVKFVLDSVIDFLEDLKLSGEPLKQAGQLLRDVEALRQSL